MVSGAVMVICCNKPTFAGEWSGSYYEARPLSGSVPDKLPTPGVPYLSLVRVSYGLVSAVGQA